jgi:hypothetical protein
VDTDMTARSGVELGVKLRADVDGRIVAVRFYKADQDTGPHTASVWGADGALLASAPFVNETASGWQEVALATAVPVTAGKTYVASYHTSAGYYAATNDFFTAAGADRPPLHALADGPQGGNGVYHYGGSAFPGDTFRSSNYWVDVVFAP